MVQRTFEVMAALRSRHGSPEESGCWVDIAEEIRSLNHLHIVTSCEILGLVKADCSSWFLGNVFVLLRRRSYSLNSSPSLALCSLTTFFHFLKPTVSWSSAMLLQGHSSVPLFCNISHHFWLFCPVNFEGNRSQVLPKQKTWAWVTSLARQWQKGEELWWGPVVSSYQEPLLQGTAEDRGQERE